MLDVFDKIKNKAIVNIIRAAIKKEYKKEPISLIPVFVSLGMALISPLPLIIGFGMICCGVYMSFVRFSYMQCSLCTWRENVK